MDTIERNWIRLDHQTSYEEGGRISLKGTSLTQIFRTANIFFILGNKLIT